MSNDFGTGIICGMFMAVIFSLAGVGLAVLFPKKKAR